MIDGAPALEARRATYEEIYAERREFILFGLVYTRDGVSSATFPKMQDEITTTMADHLECQASIVRRVQRSQTFADGILARLNSLPESAEI